MAKLIYLLELTTAVLGASLSFRDDSSCIPGSITLNNRQCLIECGVDHAGGDYSAQSGLNFQGCIQACASDPKCKTAQFLTLNQFCYLKNAIGTNSSNSNVNGIVCPDTSSSSSVTPTATAAATSCTTGLVTINGRTGSIECDTDHSGGDYSSKQVQTFLDCENACGADTNCLTAQYDSGSHFCYLKSVIYPAAPRSGLWGIVFGATSSSKSSATTTTASTSPTPATTKSTMSQTTLSTSTTSSSVATPTSSANPYDCSGGWTTMDNRQAMTQCRIDYPGGDYANQHVGSSFQACQDLCASDSICKVATYNPGSGFCYLKSTINLPVSGSVNAIKFPTATTSTTSPTSTPSCYAVAPDSPYMLNGGFERGFYDVDQNPNLSGRGGPPGNVTFKVQAGVPYNFEGCGALIASPQNTNGDIGYSQLAFGVNYYGLQAGTRYTLSFTVGGINTYNFNNAINISVYDGYNLLTQVPVCTGQALQACVISSRSNIKGKVYSTDFTGQSVSNVELVSPGRTELLFVVNWSGSPLGFFVLDDIRINLASNQTSS